MKISYPKKTIENSIHESSRIILDSLSLIPEIIQVISLITKCIKSGNKVIIFGNGGSAADAQHVAAEFIGRFRMDRKSHAALALTTDSSIITSIANDYSYDMVFSRQCDGLVCKGDVVIGISTSGNSKNVENGLIVAKKKNAMTIGILGNKGGKIKNITDVAIIVNSSDTARIQEAHRTIFHIICEVVEKNLGNAR